MREKRKFIRLKAPIGIAYKALKNKRRREGLSLIRNISAGGVCFVVKEDLRLGELLEIRIEIPHLKEPIHAVGEVVWCEGQEAGVCFMDISAENLHKILEFVHAVGIG